MNLARRLFGACASVPHLKVHLCIVGAGDR